MTVKLFEWTVFTLVFSALFVFKWAAVLIVAMIITALTVE